MGECEKRESGGVGSIRRKGVGWGVRGMSRELYQSLGTLTPVCPSTIARGACVWILLDYINVLTALHV